MPELTIPQSVIDALAIVRESGLVNMFDRNGVISIMGQNEDFEAVDWILEHDDPHSYMQALMEMGKQVSIDE